MNIFASICIGFFIGMGYVMWTYEHSLPPMPTNTKELAQISGMVYETADKSHYVVFRDFNGVHTLKVDK